DAPHAPALLRPPGKRPHGRASGNRFDEITPSHARRRMPEQMTGQRILSKSCPACHALGHASKSRLRDTAACSLRRSFNLLDQRKRGLDLAATRLQKAWKLELAPEAFHRLVHREAGLVGRDLEQDSARLAEIHRAEVIAVDLLGRHQAMLL